MGEPRLWGAGYSLAFDIRALLSANNFLREGFVLRVLFLLLAHLHGLDRRVFPQKTTPFNNPLRFEPLMMWPTFRRVLEAFMKFGIVYEKGSFHN